MTRRADVWLPDHEPRCQDNRMHPCAYADTCARALAPIPSKGATVQDFSIGLTVWMNCGDWVSAALAKRPAHKEPDRPVFPAPKGILL